jgi:hypothetical protein
MRSAFPRPGCSVYGRLPRCGRAESKTSHRTVRGAEDADLGAGEACLLQHGGDLVVAVVKGESLLGEGALRERGHVLAQLVAERYAAGRRQHLAYAPQFTHGVRPEVQDVAGQDEAGGRIPGRLAGIAGHQGQAALGEGARVAAPRWSARRPTGRRR